MLNSGHAAGSVTWSAFRPFDIPTRHRSSIAGQAEPLRIIIERLLGLDRYRYRVSADTYLSIGTDTSSPVIPLPVSTINTVATHAYSFKPLPYFCAYTLHTYITCTHLYSAQNRIFSTKKIVRPSIGICIATANSIRYLAPARYQSNPNYY